MAPATRGTRGATPVTPPAKRARTGKTAQNPVKTEDAWVDVKPEPGAKKQTATPVKRSRAKTNPASSAVVKTPATPNNEAAVAAASDAGAPDSPYPHLQRPTPEECWAARDALAQLHSAFFRHKEEAQADGSNQLGPGNLGVASPSADSNVLALQASPAVLPTHDGVLAQAVDMETHAAAILCELTCGGGSSRRAARSRVGDLLSRVQVRGALSGTNIRATAGAGVRVARGLKLQEAPVVELQALGLKVGAVGSSDSRSLIPVQPKPLQRV